MPFGRSFSFAGYMQLLKEAESRDHARLKEVLRQAALANGYAQEIEFGFGEPDVLLFDPNRKFLFIGDAKNAENETAFTLSTAFRINRYMRGFSALAGQAILGGCFAIATNDEKRAAEWAQTLRTMAMLNGLQTDTGDLLEFRVEQWDAQTWVAVWP